MKSVEKGNNLEISCSKFFHVIGIPVLVSPKFLRKMGCGQIDLCRYKNRCVEVLEVKSRRNLGFSQRKRLLKSTSFVGYVLKCPSILSYYFNPNENS